MPFDKDAIRTALGPGAECDAPLAPFTTLRIGGPAEFLYHARSAEDVMRCARVAGETGLPLSVLGGGSNTVIADAGVRGIVLLMENATFEKLPEAKLAVGAGVRLGQLVAFCAQEGLGGVEWLAGIPGTVGGALYGNAGSTTVGLGERTETIRVWNGEGIVTLLRAACAFGYRQSRFKTKKEIILDAVFLLEERDPAQLRAAIANLIAQKHAHQPTASSSAGCMFKNPPGLSAGKLIDEVGLKGKRIGNVEISEKHGNFFVNRGGATADDVAMLISYVKQQVRDRRGIQLQEEVQFLGFREDSQT